MGVHRKNRLLGGGNFLKRGAGAVSRFKGVGGGWGGGLARKRGVFEGRARGFDTTLHTMTRFYLRYQDHVIVCNI